MRDGFEKSDRVVVRDRPERLVNTFDIFLCERGLKYQEVIMRFSLAKNIFWHHV